MLTPAQMAEYLKGLAKEKQFDEARTGKLLSLIEGDADVTLTRAELRELLEPIVELPFGRHATFSQKMNEVQGFRNTLEKWRTDEMLPAFKQANDRAASALAKVAKFEERYGSIDEIEDEGGGKGRTLSGEIIDIKKVQEIIAERESGMAKQFLAFQLDQDRLTREHFSRFKEIPDLSKLMEVVAEAAKTGKSLSLPEAYTEVYGEKVQAHTAEAENKRIDAEVSKRLNAERARRPAGANGAAIPEDGSFFAHYVKEQKGEAKPQSDADLEAAFNADYAEELAKRDISFNTQ